MIGADHRRETGYQKEDKATQSEETDWQHLNIHLQSRLEFQVSASASCSGP